MNRVCSGGEQGEKTRKHRQKAKVSQEKDRHHRGRRRRLPELRMGANGCVPLADGQSCMPSGMHKLVPILFIHWFVPAIRLAIAEQKMCLFSLEGQRLVWQRTTVYHWVVEMELRMEQKVSRKRLLGHITTTMSNINHSVAPFMFACSPSTCLYGLAAPEAPNGIDFQFTILRRRRRRRLAGESVSTLAGQVMMVCLAKSIHFVNSLPPPNANVSLVCLPILLLKVATGTRHSTTKDIRVLLPTRSHWLKHDKWFTTNRINTDWIVVWLGDGSGCLNQK